MHLELALCYTVIILQKLNNKFTETIAVKTFKFLKIKFFWLFLKIFHINSIFRELICFRLLNYFKITYQISTVFSLFGAF